jgi:hypothetical protein
MLKNPTYPTCQNFTKFAKPAFEQVTNFAKLALIMIFLTAKLALSKLAGKLPMLN